VADFIDNNFQREADFLKSLVRVPSDNPPGDCARHATEAARLYEGLGFSVERHPVPRDVCAKHGMVSVTNLIVRHRFGTGRGPTVALNAHGDVVPPGTGWTVDPYGGVEKDGAIYGRGAAVSKSDFATYGFALMALRAAPAGLDGTVEIHLTYDEETGGFVGPYWLLEQGLTKPDFVISAGFSYAIVTAHNGCLHLDVTVRGKQAHAAMPETGADALEATTSVLAAIYEERRRIAERSSEIAGIGSPKITVGVIQGGINTNVVPGEVRMKIDRRIIPEENGEEVEASLRALIEKAATAHPGVTVEMKRIILAVPMKPAAGIDKLVAALKTNAERELGTEIEVKGVPLYTDARLYSERGIPTVLYGAGPRTLIEAGGHAADEHVQLSDLKAATKVIAGAIRDLLKVKA
jgi:acetylornithine deacetylase/succinyl-diaminopimelate desuccinylase family protein